MMPPPEVWCEVPRILQPGVKIRASNSLLRGLGQGFERYLVTESLQLTDQPLRVRLPGSLPIEVILAELLVGYSTLQHVVADHQDRVPTATAAFLEPRRPLRRA